MTMTDPDYACRSSAIEAIGRTPLLALERICDGGLKHLSTDPWQTVNG